MWNRGWCACSLACHDIGVRVCLVKGEALPAFTPSNRKTKFSSEKMMGYDVAAA